MFIQLIGFSSSINIIIQHAIMSNTLNINTRETTKIIFNIRMEYFFQYETFSGRGHY